MYGGVGVCSPQTAAGPLFQASWGGASTRDDHVIISTRSQTAFGGPGARYAAVNRADLLHSHFFNEIAPVLVLMLYSHLNHRVGYRLPDKLTAAVAKPGVLPQWLVEYGVFIAFWQNLMMEVNLQTADGAGVNAMMALASAVNDMMALPHGASQREIDEAWLVAAHRILYRLDKTCNTGDLQCLANEDSGERHQAMLRAQSVTSMAARAKGYATSSSSRDGPRDSRPFKRSRDGGGRSGGFFRDRPMTYCENHKRMVYHSASECNLRPRGSDASGK
jgi:hypothetical protein